MSPATYRAPVYSRNGVVAASQPLAVSAGIEILTKGGSAGDAAIAVSAVLAVVEPGASHLGGDAFVIAHGAARKENLAFNGSGEAPAGAVADNFINQIDHHGYRSATVPGVVSTWFAIHSQYGLLSIDQLLAPAIDFARNGFPANTGFIKRMASHLYQFPDTKVFQDLGIDSKLKVGDLVFQSDLADSLETIATHGRSAFYSGQISEQLISASNGWFSQRDLEEHRTRVLPPLTIKYRDYYIHGQPPPSQGMILLEELLIAEGFELEKLSTHDRIHLMVEAKKIAFADRYALLGDPEHVDIGLENLFSNESIALRRSQINLNQANLQGPLMTGEGSDTTYFLTADRDGNALSWIQSVFHGFGASWVIPGSGILLNNRLTGFSLDAKSPNFIAPRKRPAHTLNAWSITKENGSLAYMGGTPGANIQVQSNFQLIVNAIDLKMDPQQNAEAPRWQHLNQPSQSSLDENYQGVLQIENRVSKQVQDSLALKGHVVEELPAYGHGSAVQLLQVLDNGTYIAGSDPRCEGQAAGI